MPAPDPDAILAGLDPEQRAVAQATSGPVCVLAGAGTGKTRAITHRLAYAVAAGIYQPSQVLALTFTARAAGEMRTRLHGLGAAGIQARTFHAAALRQLQYFWPQAVGGAPPQLADHKAPLVGEAAGRLRLKADRSAVRDLSAEIEWAKVNLLSPEQYPAAASKAGRAGAAGHDPRTIGRLLQTYEDVKTAHARIDFEDVLIVLVGILREHGRIAETVRSQYRHFVVDEYQDVSPLQQALLAEWLGDSSEVCVVGDPSQTIYSFAGADPRFLLDFRRTHPSGQVLKLVRDYRSTPQIVALANQLLDAAPPAARTARVELIAQREPGPAPEVHGYGDDVDEAEQVATRIAALLTAGTDPSEIAVLYRTNAQSAPLETELSARGIAYQVRGGERFFARAEVRRAVMLLRGAARAGQAGTPLPQQVRDVLAGGGWTPTPPATTGAVRDQWESLQALAVLADDLVAERRASSLGQFVAELDARAAAAHAPSPGGVTLSSLHAAKGLEWDVVFIVGLSEGLLPITFAGTPAAVEEERRLLYVGVTRARLRLLLSWSASRSIGGRGTRLASRFLGPISRRGGGRVGPTERERTPSRKRESVLHTTCRSCGTALTGAVARKLGRCEACPPDYDEAVFEALRAWRTELARELKKPAYVIFTDSTLQAIAFDKPADSLALLRISGVGHAKLDAYGREVLAVVAGRQPGSLPPAREGHAPSAR